MDGKANLAPKRASSGMDGAVMGVQGPFSWLWLAGGGDVGWSGGRKDQHQPPLSESE